LGARFASAAALTLDGLIAVNDNHDVLCLALESGQTRWQAGLGLDLLSTAAAASALRSTVEGDLVIFQSNDGSAAFKTFPATDGYQMAWKGATLIDAPPRQSLQLSDSYVVEMMLGPIANRTARSAQVVIRDRKGGKTALRAPISAQTGVLEGPAIRSWQVVDGAIALEVVQAAGTGTPGFGSPASNAAGKIYLWRTKPSP
jgi:hypothetical protein